MTGTSIPLRQFEAFRGKPGELAMLCALLRHRGSFGEALLVGQAAVAEAPDSLAVVSDVGTALSEGVPEYHRPMLFDQARNQIYAKAIAQAVKPGMLVLEIGCGAGLLAMLAARAGAQVVTCESNPMVAAAAAQVIELNGFADRISLVPMRSTAMKIGEHLPRRADLVIHEVFGSRLFDEGVTASMTDARERLLRDDAVAVPPTAMVRCALARKERPSARRNFADVEGFDLSPFELLTMQPRSVSRSTRDYRFCSAPISALQMNYSAAAPFGAPSERHVVSSSGGRIDGVIQWIQIEFDGGGRYENAPLSEGEASHWGAQFLRLPTPIETEAGDQIEVTLRHRDALLSIDARKIDRSPSSEGR